MLSTNHSKPADILHNIGQPIYCTGQIEYLLDKNRDQYADLLAFYFMYACMGRNILGT